MCHYHQTHWLFRSGRLAYRTSDYTEDTGNWFGVFAPERILPSEREEAMPHSTSRILGLRDLLGLIN